MTTIAWDGKMLAADRRAQAGYGLIFTTRKIMRTADGRLIGGAGQADIAEAMKKWLSLPEPERGERPLFQETGDHNTIVLEIMLDGTCLRHEQYGCVAVLDQFHAIGGGRDFAIAAMALGKSAAEAIELASRFDCGTGNGIDVLKLDESDGR